MPTKVQHTYLVLFKGDDSDFIGNQNIVLNLETDLDLTGCKAHFKFLDFAQDFTEIPEDKQLELVFPKAQTAKFPLGAMDAELWLEDSTGKRRTVSNRIHIVVTNSVPEAYNNEDTQAITVTIASGSGGIDPTKILEGVTMETNTLVKIREAIQTIGTALGATVTALAMMLLPCRAATNTVVQSVDIRNVDLDSPVEIVTNVDCEALVDTNQLHVAVTNLEEQIAQATPENYSVVADAAMSAASTNDLKSAVSTTFRESTNYTDIAIASATNALPRIVESESNPGYAANAAHAISANEASVANSATSLGNRSAPAIIEQLDAATATNALQGAALRDIADTIGNLASKQDVISATNTLNSTIPNNISRSASDATILHCDDGTCTNALFYIRQATTTLAGLMTAADKVKLNNQTAIITTWESFLDGSNVVFAITNYISGTYTATDGKFKIMELRDGSYREIYNSHKDIQAHIDDFKNNDFKNATNDVMTTVNNTVANKADKDWGKYSSSGTLLESVGISNTVYMTSQKTVFAGGLEFERVQVGSGVIGVLTAKGAAAYTTGDSGTFKFQDVSSTNFFGYTKTDDYIIGCDTDAITVSGDLVSLRYDVVSSSYPIIFYIPTLDNYNPENWEQLNDEAGDPISGATYEIAWDVSVPEQFTAMINVAGNPQGFFMAKMAVSGDASFETNMKARFSRGILCTDGIHTIKFDWNGGSPRLISGE